MMRVLVSLVSLSLHAVISVRACEGQCIVDITHAFVGNYSAPVQHVFADVAVLIARTILPSHSTMTASKLVEPLLDAYERGAYNAMEKAIFPSYFHGKCQVNGVDPAGCPNPDCPVVCGTPGSMVHFYSVLKEIAFNSTAANLASLCSPSSKTYKNFEASVLHALHANAPRRRSLRTTSLRSHSRHQSLGRSTAAPHGTSRNAAGGLQKRNDMSDAQAKTRLESVCKGTVNDLGKKCGGSTGLPNCSWEKDMKAFILSFP